MHGNEPVGREMLAHLATYLLRARGLVPRVDGILNTTDITLIPTINPDGFDRGTEGACSGRTFSHHPLSYQILFQGATTRLVGITRETGTSTVTSPPGATSIRRLLSCESGGSRRPLP
jgi:hypothetical protein